VADDVILRIKVLADASAAAAGLKKAEDSASKWQTGLRKAAVPAAAAGAALVALGAKAVRSASDLQQAEGAIEAVFGTQARAVERNANKAAKTMGLSAAAYENYAALVGTALQNAGFSVEQSVTESNRVMQRGADLSALYGGTTADAVEAINAAVSRSEFDPLEKYGVTLNMTAVNAELAAKGQDKLTGAALATAKKQAILEQVYKQSSKAAGQYARESDSVAGSQQTAAAEFENASAALGKVLLPLVSAAVSELAKFATWAQKNTTTVQVLAGVLAGLAATILVANAAMRTAAIMQGIWNGLQLIGARYALGTRVQLVALTAAQVAQAAATKVVAAATKAWTIVQAAFNAVMSANVIVLVVIAILALAAALVIAYQRSATFRAFVDAMWRGIQAGARAALAVIRAVWNAVLATGRAVAAALQATWAVVWALLSAYVRVYAAVFRAVFGVIRGIASAVAAAVRGDWSGVGRALTGIANTIRNALVSAFNALRSAAAALHLTGPFDAVVGAINAVINAVKSLIGWLGRIKVPKISLPKIPGVSRAASPSVAAASASRAAPLGLAAAPRVSSGTSAGVVINITGAVDPEGTARQIRRILSASDVRHGAARSLRTV
jgi:hypothetical protein